MIWPPSFKKSARFDPKSFDVAWTSENFDIIISSCMEYSTSTEDRIATLRLYNKTTARIDCREPLWYMLYALYLIHPRDNHFLSSIVLRNYSAGQMSSKEIYHVAKTLKQHKAEILSLVETL